MVVNIDPHHAANPNSTTDPSPSSTGRSRKTPLKTKTKTAATISSPCRDAVCAIRGRPMSRNANAILCGGFGGDAGAAEVLTLLVLFGVRGAGDLQDLREDQGGDGQRAAGAELPVAGGGGVAGEDHQFGARTDLHATGSWSWSARLIWLSWRWRRTRARRCTILWRTR